MNIEPILRCRQCGFLTHSGFSFGASAHVTLSGCATQCVGCQRMLLIPDMSSFGGDVVLFRRAADVDVFIARIVEFSRRLVERQGQVLEIDERLTPSSLRWALPLLKRHPQIALLLASALFQVGIVIWQQIDTRRLQAEDHKFARELAQIQYSQAERLASQGDASSAKELREAAETILLLLREIETGQIDSQRELAKAVHRHNQLMATIHALLASEGSSQRAALPSRTSTEHMGHDESRAMTAGRHQPCPCGSGLKFKRCHGRRF